MPEASDGGDPSTAATLVPNQLASLVPTFDPAKDEILEYTKKVQLLMNMWPEGKWTELATRLILGCSGTAFQKLQLHSSEVTSNEKKSIQKIIELLGGQWGQIPLERKYEAAERALFRCTQRSDETNDSYLARADILWQELTNKAMDIQDLQAYITLRGSNLSSEDKKRVVLDCETSSDGKLTMTKVSSAVRMLGAGFFQEMTSGKKTGKLKTYDASTFMSDNMDMEEPQNTLHAETGEDFTEEDAIEALCQEGDEDAVLITDFEVAASEVLQNDEELASAFNAYAEARKRLSDKVKSRGFWPPSKGKGKPTFKGVKGKFQKGHQSNRRSLQQRILTSHCRLCGRIGHWKAECPTRNEASANSRPQASASFVQVQDSPIDGLPLEFISLPTMEGTMDETHLNMGYCFTCQGGVNDDHNPKDKLKRALTAWHKTEGFSSGHCKPRSEDPTELAKTRLRRSLAAHSATAKFRPSESIDGESPALFATYSSMGVVDLGATKTVIGSQLVQGLLNGLNSHARKLVRRCPCSITFRFGNQGTLQSEHALVLPVFGMWLRIAIVPGSTPLLLSNTLLRAMGAVIDTSQKVIHATKVSKTIPIQLTEKGLFLLDLNDLVDTSVSRQAAETHQVSEVPKDRHQPDVNATANSSQDKTFHSCNSATHPDDSQVNSCPYNISQTCPTHDQCLDAEAANPTEITDRSTREHQQCSDRMHSVDHRCSNHSQFARSFKFPTKDRHVHFEHAFEGSPSARRDTPVQLRPHEHEAVGGQCDRLRTGTTGSEVSGSLGTPSGLGDMVHQQVRKVCKGKPSTLSPFCATQDRTCRARGQEHPSECRTEDVHGEAQDETQGGSPPDLPSPSGKHARPGRGGGALRATADGGGDVSPSHRCAGKSDRAPGDQDVAHGRCSEPNSCPPGESGSDPRGSVDSCPSWAQSLYAGELEDHATECFAEAPETNVERNMFNKLIKQLTHELQACQNTQSSTTTPRCDVLEVFCNPQSQLTHQCIQLGHRAMRFGLAEGDLQTPEGRQKLFQVVLKHRPRHIWFSPKCGPWSGWSNLNGSKSIQAWDMLQQSRLQHLDQVALGIVLMRHQRSLGSHFHWEQPQGSHMFRLPYLQEVRQHLLAMEVDLCTAGNLMDPNTQLHIRKALTIMTSSRNMYHDMHGLKCQGNHQHQQIEGSCLFHGRNVNRSTFTENYPRKFARRIAKNLCRLQIPKELPYRSEEDQCLWNWTLAGETAPSERPAKKPRLGLQARPKTSRAREISDLPWGKRTRFTGKTTNIDANQMWKDVFDDVQKLAPRVGKVIVTDPKIVNTIQQLILDKRVVTIVACRGTNRTLAPPENIAKGEAPYRRSIFIERSTGVMKAEDDWEHWENLAKRQLIRASHACRLNITVFACNLATASPSIVSRPEAPMTVHPNLSEIPSAEVPPAGEASSPDPPSGRTETQRTDLGNMRQSKTFTSLTTEEQQALIRAHKNLGHPNPEKFSSIIRQQGFRPEVARAALELKCSTCQSQMKPKTGSPGKLRDDLDFNDRVCADGVTWVNAQGQGFHFYHFVDWSTSFQVACAAPSRATEAVIDCFTQSWLSWAGTPSELIVDAATEFNSEGFSQFAQTNNLRVTTISTEAHFQNGKAERHGAILQNMLTKYEKEHPITSYAELKQGLWWCVQAKNAFSLRKGYSPEVLVLGKQTRLPGSICSDELLPAHMLADAETSQGVQFRQQLARRESARRAFVMADNDSALRKAILRKSHGNPQHYNPGEWVMVWREGKGANPGQWTGPMKVVVHENPQTIWTSMTSKLYRAAPEHVRPVSAMEARNIVILPNEPSVSQIAQQIPQSVSNQTINGNTPYHDIQLPIADAPPNPPTIPISQNNVSPNNPEINNPSTHDSHSENQPDAEPGATGSNSTPSGSQGMPPNPESVLDPNRDMAREFTAQNTPIPDGTDGTDDDLVCDALHCHDLEPESMELRPDQAWQCEIYVTDHEIHQWRQEDNPMECAFIASAAKRQRAEVKLTQLTSEEKAEFQKAKTQEVQNWLRTGTISRILRDQVPKDQILRCRWILTWKPIDDIEKEQMKGTKNHKAKARLVILGYLDPKLDEVPRDSPTLGRHSKMLLLQFVSSMKWALRSFDIKAAFLQGKNQKSRVLAIEPVPEIVQMMKLTPQEICKLEKGAYGLVDAPFMWYQAILEELVTLGFEQSPFDPCLFILRNRETLMPDGILGLHVDDGLCGGNEHFLHKLELLEKKYPFGSKRINNFTFTGIDIQQSSDGTIHLSQSKYVKAIDPIKISTDRRKQSDEKVSEEERQQLRALIGSLQYAAVHTRPDLSSRLSNLQSSINSATVENLITANQVLHEAKKHHDVTIKVQSININDLRFLAFSDASFASKSNPNSHTGTLIMATHKDIGSNITCPVNAISWGCKKIQRVVTSTLAAETTSLNSVLDHLSWIRLCWAWILDPNTKWKSPHQTLKQLPETYTTATLNAKQLPETFAATDCKSLFDLVSRTAMPNCAEFRTQLTARAIKDLLNENVSLRWVHSGAQLADALTKIMENSFFERDLEAGTLQVT